MLCWISISLLILYTVSPIEKVSNYFKLRAFKYFAQSALATIIKCLLLSQLSL